MFVIVLTGGIGAGKSVAADYFRSRGASLLGLDEAAHRLLETDADIHDAVVGAFGTEVLAADGSIDRRKLASAAFGSPERAACLNGIVHPALATDVQTELLEMRSSSASPRVLVLEVPLLVEAPVFAGSADSVLAISAPEGLRVQRAVDAGMAEADVRARIACQASDAEREALANWVIVNDGSLADFFVELQRYWDEVVAPRASQ